VPPGVGGQWTAQYFNNASLSGTPAAVFSENTPTHNWATNVPFAVSAGECRNEQQQRRESSKLLPHQPIMPERCRTEALHCRHANSIRR
jgi:hypothetical protein